MVVVVVVYALSTAFSALFSPTIAALCVCCRCDAAHALFDL
jgi:hypothetical protein